MDHGLGPVTSGVAMPTGVLAATTTFTLTVTNAAGDSVTATAAVQVVPPPVIFRFAATHAALPAGSATTLTATFAGGAGAVDQGLGAVLSGVQVPTGDLAQSTSYTLTVTNAAGDSVTSTATVALLPATSVITFTTEGETFAPVLVVEGSPDILWTFADGTTSTSRSPTKAYGSAASRPTTLMVTPWRALRRINLGYDGGDGGSPAIELVPDQHVSAVAGLEVVAPTLAQWCSSYNQLTALDFGDFTNLDTIECYHSATLRSVRLTNTPRLGRACFEDCDLVALDLSGSPRLADLRGALNAFPTIDFGGGRFAETWHVCIRDNPQLASRALFADAAQFPALSELWIWNANQAGALRLGSTHPTLDVSILAAANQYDALLLAGALQNPGARGVVNLQQNLLTRVDLTGCVQVTELYLADNLLGEAEADGILATLDSLGRARLGASDLTPLVVDLTGNASPSAAGRASAVRLASRGWTVRTRTWTETPPAAAGPTP
ncbi:MAG: hypothetical protein IPQ24_03910 [Anaeromyxobacter sp.]|nr:hypothetical protein [Anaeromyxobacter sp.]